MEKLGKLASSMILLVAAASCARPRTALEQCRAADPRLTDRESHGWYWTGAAVQFGSHARPGPLDIVERRRRCLVTVTVRSASRTYEVGPFERADHYIATIGGTRLAFVVTDGDGLHAVVDGEVGPAFRDFLAAPRFSLDGAHVAYIGRSAADSVLVVDGRVQLRVPRFHDSVFEIMNDGRAAAAVESGGGGFHVVVGKEEGPTFDGFNNFVIGPLGARHAYVGYRGRIGHAVVDQREIAAPGAARGRVLFSPDEQHYAYVVGSIDDPAGHTDRAIGWVLDGRFVPLDDVTDVGFVDGARLLVKRHRPGEPVEAVLADGPTPRVPPTCDDYRNLQSTDPGIRLVLGESVGPVLDAIHFETLHVGADGTVTYEGSRGDQRFSVVDNVLPYVKPAPEKQ